MSIPNGHPWTPDHLTILTAHYGGGNCAAMVDMLGRSWEAIRTKAYRVGLNFSGQQVSREYSVDPCITALRIERIRQGKSLDDIAELCGYARSALAKWEHGHSQPNIKALRDWSASLGLTLGFFERGK